MRGIGARSSSRPAALKHWVRRQPPQIGKLGKNPHVSVTDVTATGDFLMLMSVTCLYEEPVARPNGSDNPDRRGIGRNGPRDALRLRPGGACRDGSDHRGGGVATQQHALIGSKNRHGPSSSTAGRTGISVTAPSDRSRWATPRAQTVMKPFILALALTAATSTLAIAHHEGGDHSSSASDEGLGRAHIETSCAPAVATELDRAVASLHNFWYARAFERFNRVAQNDPECAMAYWGAAMTYNHPFWDPPSQADETAAWALVQKGLRAQEASDREKLYLSAVAALYKDAGAGTRLTRDEHYRDAMAAVYVKYPDDETKLFYGLSILSAIPEGAKGFAQQGEAARLFEDVYSRHPDHPGVLHYLIHAYDDPEHAQQGLKAARAYAAAAAAVPHALHMPSHIFTRLGYWEESAATNLRGWEVSEADVRRAGESGAYRDFHDLSYLEYAYIQLGRYRDAQHTVDIIAAQYEELCNKRTAPDTAELQARHVRGRTIYTVPDRVVYGYFDMLTRLIVESGHWDEISQIPLLVSSRDFAAVKLQWEAKSAAVRKDPGTARAAAGKLVLLSQEPGQDPFANLIISLQAKEAEAFAADALGDVNNAVVKLKEAAAMEDAIDDLSQPPYPVIPANELLGNLLLELNRSAEAAIYFQKALKRTPNRPKAILGLARAAQALGDEQTAVRRYEEFLTLWKAADPDLPELTQAKAFLRGRLVE
jgi:tetratricopeptide (TPR) repeat protein